MARRRQGEPGVTVLLLCWVGGCDRVIVPASPPLGREGVYIPSHSPISIPHHHPHPRLAIDKTFLANSHNS